jgi:hypothetical protein
LAKYVSVNGILFLSAQPAAGNSKRLAVSIKSRLIKVPACILFLMLTAIASTRNAILNMSFDSDTAGAANILCRRRPNIGGLTD